MFIVLSAGILFSMYFMIFILITVFVLISGLYGLFGVFSIGISVLITLVIIIFHFFLSPFVYDIVLRLLYRCNFVTINEIPYDSVREFIRSYYAKNNLRPPRIGIIEDDTPTAFTYGNFPSNARIIVSRGLFKIMDEEELKAVFAHEMGHIFHYDFVFMTLATIVPMIIYYIYSVSSDMLSQARRNQGLLILFVIFTYIFYIISEYLVLYLSRLREYGADRFSAYTTRNPNALATALIKIGYGLLNFNPESKESREQEKSKGGRSILNSPFKVLGLMDYKQARGISIAALNSGTLGVSAIEVTLDEVISKTTSAISKIMAWDLFNPWASVLELQSTHPLIAKRIKSLSNIAAEMGLPFHIEVPRQIQIENTGGVDILPGSLWDEFLIDFFFEYAPIIGSLVGALISSPCLIMLKPSVFFAFILAGAATGSLLKWIFTYSGKFKEYNIFDLLCKTKVSIVRSIPSIIEGQIIGREQAGFILSEDVLLRDNTGFIYVDYKTGISFGDLMYGFFITKGLIGQEATIKGYYRRSLFPYIEVIEIKTKEGKTYRSYFRFIWLAAIFILYIISFVLGLFGAIFV
ncbi:MAG: M48 family metalloprotease [bacterium]